MNGCASAKRKSDRDYRRDRAEAFIEVPNNCLDICPHRGKANVLVIAATQSVGSEVEPYDSHAVRHRSVSDHWKRAVLVCIGRESVTQEEYRPEDAGSRRGGGPDLQLRVAGDV